MTEQRGRVSVCIREAAHSILAFAPGFGPIILLGDSLMQFLRNTTLNDLLGKPVEIILRSNRQTIETISGEVFLVGGKVMIDCIPALDRKYTTPMPDDAIAVDSVDPLSGMSFAVFIHPHSEAGRFIRSLLDAKQSGETSVTSL